MPDGKYRAPISLDKRDYPDVYGAGYEEPEKPEPLRPKIVTRDGKYLVGEDGELYPAQRNPYALAEVKKGSIAYPAVRYEAIRQAAVVPAGKKSKRKLADYRSFVLDKNEQLIFARMNAVASESYRKEARWLNIITASFLGSFILTLGTGLEFLPLAIGFGISLPYFMLLIMVLKAKYGRGTAECIITDKRVICKRGKEIMERKLSVLTDVKLEIKKHGRTDVYFYTGKGTKCALEFQNMKTEEAKEVYSLIKLLIGRR